MTVQNALGFNDNGDFLTRTTNLIDYNSAYTVMAWLYFDSFSDYAHFWAAIAGAEGVGDYNNSDFMGHDNSNPGLSRMGAAIGGSFTFPTGAAFSATTWVHLTLTRESVTSLKLYINAAGTPAITDTLDITGRTAVGTEIIARLNAGYGLKGRIACLKQWSVALTTTEIATEKDKAYAVKTASLHEVWNFTADANRYVGAENGYTWTTNGSMTDETGPDLEEAGGGTANPWYYYAQN